MKKPAKFDSPFEVYRVVDVIGEGGTGRVFRVVDSEGREFALKCLLPHAVSDDRRRRFKNEVEFCQRQAHPNIIRVIDAGSHDVEGVKCPFYVMRVYSGTLRTVMHEGRRPEELLGLFGEILDGVEAAHLQHVCHRDLKPENILVGKKAVVADFGIARFSTDIAATIVETKAGARLANFQYAAPEQRGRSSAIGAPVDIYALGLILSELLTGEIPQGSEYKQIGERLPELSYLDGVVDQMIRQDPAARPQSIDEIKKQLIARKAEFVARQKIDSLKKQVVPATSPDLFDPIRIVGFDYQGGDYGKLVVELNRAPSDVWVRLFQDPPNGFPMPLGGDPRRYSFRGHQASVDMPARDAQRFRDALVRYVEKANQEYPQLLERLAKEKEHELKKKLQQEVTAEEARAEVLRKLRE